MSKPLLLMAFAAVLSAAKQLNVDLKAKYADWPNLNVTGFVRGVYAE